MKKLLMMLMLICTVNIACWADGDEPETEGDEVELYDDEEIDPIKEVILAIHYQECLGNQ